MLSTTDLNKFTAERVNEDADKTERGIPSQRSSSPLTTFPVSSSEIERRTPPPSYTPPFSSARDSLVSAPTNISQQASRTVSKQTFNENISRPYVLRPNPPVRRISARAVGRPSPILTRRLSRPKVAYVSSPPPPTPPLKRLVDSSLIQRPREMPSKYTLDLPDAQSRLMSSPRMRGLVTNSYTDLKPKRRVSRRKSNTSLRSSASDRFETTYSGNTSDNGLPPVPTLLHHPDFNIQHSNTDAAPPTSTSSMPPSTTATDPSTSSLPRRAKASRYLRNPPPPLQLTASSHRPRTGAKRYSSSRRVSRETHRASVQSPDSSTFPGSPFTPRPKTPSKKEQQRRRLLKLRRTLGEDVPLELLTPPLSSGPSAVRMRDLASLRPGATTTDTVSKYSQPPISVAATPVSTLLPTLPRTEKRGAFALGMRRKKNLLAPHTSNPAARTAPLSILAPIRVSVDKNVSSELSPPRRASSPPVILISAHPYSNISISSSSDDTSPPPAASTYYLARGSIPHPSTPHKPPSDSSEESRRSHWPRTPFAHAIELAGAAEPTCLAPPPSFAGGAGNGTTARRSERRQGWSGEWNRPDMQDVIAKLRDI